MINTTSITEAIYTALDIFSLFVVSALPIEITYHKIDSSKKGPVWKNATSYTNDDFPPKDGDGRGILIEKHEEAENPYSPQEIRANAEPCLFNDNEHFNLLNNAQFELPATLINHPNDVQLQLPALLGLSPIFQ